APEGALSTAQLAVLVHQIAATPSLWEPLSVHDATRRRYRLIYEDDRIDVWVLSWMPGQGTGFHDHDLSGVALTCAQGMVVERQMQLPSGATRIEMEVGLIREGGPGYIHSVAYGRGDPAISIHAYSPPLVRVGQFSVDEEGIMYRRITHGRQELMDNTIAERDPSRA
ncbi:cysteine dioxygenase family protein, partial [bacterium]|nr:cysteine dioxygenase family protein [bacterium]